MWMQEGMINWFRTAWGLIKQTASDWMSDNAPRLGASLAYYTVFSLSPLMIIVLAIARLWFGEQASEAARHQIFAEIAGLVGPQSAQAIQSVLASAGQKSHGIVATTVALITLLIGSTGVFVELQDALKKDVWIGAVITAFRPTLSPSKPKTSSRRL